MLREKVAKSIHQIPQTEFAINSCIFFSFPERGTTPDTPTRILHDGKKIYISLGIEWESNWKGGGKELNMIRMIEANIHWNKYIFS